MSAKPPVPLVIPAVLVTATAASILSTDLYAPSLPHLPEYFATDAGTVQLTMSLNLLGFALAMLVYGPLVDRFGRRPVILAGMSGFAVASLACTFAWSIESLIAARVVQGIAAASQSVVVLAVIRDLYDDAGAVRVMGAYGMAVALAPAVAPMAGGLIHVWLGWRVNFAVLTVIGAAVTALLWRFLPETAGPGRRALSLWRLFTDYGGLLRRRRFVGYALVSTFTFGGLFAFITAAPFVFIDRLGVRTDIYGVYYASMVLAYLLGSFIANRGAGRIAVERLLQMGMAVVALGGAGMPVLLWAGWESPAGISAVFALYALGMGVVFAVAPIRALDAATGGHGGAAAMLGTLEMSGGSLGALAVGAFHDGTAWPLAMVVCAYGLGAPAAYVLACRDRRGKD
jgi:MFS transporter, DHA1 family, multidrug resistance protein